MRPNNALQRAVERFALARVRRFGQFAPAARLNGLRAVAERGR